MCPVSFINRRSSIWHFQTWPNLYVRTKQEKCHIIIGYNFCLLIFLRSWRVSAYHYITCNYRGNSFITTVGSFPSVSSFLSAVLRRWRDGFVLVLSVIQIDRFYFFGRYTCIVDSFDRTWVSYEWVFVTSIKSWNHWWPINGKGWLLRTSPFLWSSVLGNLLIDHLIYM